MKLRYPLRTEDAMKIIDYAFGRAVELTKPFQNLASSIKLLAKDVKELALAVAVVAQNQAVHHRMIGQIWNVQQHIFRKLQESTLDTSMPDIGASKPAVDLKDEVAIAKAKAANKPN